MKCTIHLLLSIVLVIAGTMADGPNRKPVTSPPRIQREPDQEVAYKEGERVELPCEAAGEPKPSYEWRKDGLPLDFNGIDYKRLPGVGTLVIVSPKDIHEGTYQCFAKNELGTALSVKSTLKIAVLDTFPTITEPYVHHPVVGTFLRLSCNPPFSYPEGLVYWAMNKPGTKFKPIETNARIATDYSGSLYFANIVPGDDIEGKNYVCIIQNDVIRSMAQGDDAVIIPFAAGPTPNYAAPSVKWTSESPTVVLLGRTKKMKCIFAGYPTPTVRWERIGSTLQEKAKLSAYGLELEIPDAQYEDAGTYRCLANNTKSGVPVSRTFDLRVNSLPLWVTEPSSVDSSEEEQAEFVCDAGGVPKPKVSWTVNGGPIENLPKDGRIVVEENRILFTNLSKSDAQVLQCNASNRHGYIFKNVYLNVLAEPPSFTTPPQAVVKVAEGQNVNLTCRVFGAPKPRISWWSGDENVLDRGTRFQLMKTGDLQILNVQLGDEGTFECRAWNKFGQEQKSGNLIVRSATVITNGPEDQSVNASDDVILHCDAITDNDELAKLKIEWRRNGRPIDFQMEGRVSMNMMDNSLKITDAQVMDTAEYTCIASNGLDSVEEKAKITVKDRPSPPYDIRLESCGTSAAQVAWTPDSDNNDPIIDFTLYYNTSFDDPGVFHVAQDDIPANVNSARASLTPWANYTFHVKARNSLGMSDPSAFTAAYCTTPPMIPYKNPENVCSRSGDPDKLIITWERMELMDHNGEDFHYMVGYKPRKNSGDAIEVRVTDYRQTEIIIPGQPIFQEYEIYVQAANSKGRSPGGVLDRKIAYSGEDTPLDAPTGLEIDEETLNSTYAMFMWDPIDEDPARIRGHFLGYRITYWKTDDPDDKRSTDVILNDFDHCPPLRRRRRRDTSRIQKRQVALERGHVNDLWPYSQITAGVTVLNGGNSGPLSDTIGFSTPEGFPGEILSLEVTERGSHHFRLAWSPPLQPNGVIIGYLIKYKPIDVYGAIEEKFEPVGLTTKLTDLEADTKYLIYIHGVTSVGTGVEHVIEDSTLPLSNPDTPGIADIEYGDTSLNVSWTPTADGQRQDNPGQEFYVEIRKAGSDDEWERTSPDDEKNWANITGLEYGESYDLRIVAVNGAGDETRSPTKTVTVGPKEEPVVQDIATAGWFIGMLCAILFLIIIILIICLIKRNRGGKYPVHEKEKLRGRDPDNDENDFGEYTRADYPEKPVDRDSLASDRPLEGSDEDSLEEYGDPDMTAGFDEDGSFIKQYGTKGRKDGQTNNALSTFV